MRNGYDNMVGEVLVYPDGSVVYQSNVGNADYGRASFCYIASS